MTIVRNITSHSERAAAIEASLYSNTLASRASQAAFLLRVLEKGTPRTSVPRLVDSAQKFIAEVSMTAATHQNPSRQSFRNLIPVNIVMDAFGDDLEEIRAVATDLNEVLKSGNANSDYEKLASRLLDVSNALSEQASQARKSKIGA